MMLFKDSRGFVFSIGFDMIARKPHPYMICWCDPPTGEWETKLTNMAGNFMLPFFVIPQFIRECGDTILIYQPGSVLELTYTGSPFIWSYKRLLPQQE